jgi:hypothetical protein
MKVFNTTAVCIPSENYMVDISDKLRQIAELIEQKKYFTINRARQYGKTTTLMLLEDRMSGSYDFIGIDFQDVTDAMFADESSFTKGLAQVLCDSRDAMELPMADDVYERLSVLGRMSKQAFLNDLFRIFDYWCKENEKPVVLMIDEVDSATNNQVFLDFLGKLRSSYLKRRKNNNYKTFQSVILTGVTDVKHLRSKIRPEDEHKENSPWNIAADFTVDMSLSEEGIKGMLNEYEKDHTTGMNTAEIAKQIREYTSGYPFLVSRICQLIDEQVCKMMDPADAWTVSGVCEAVKLLLAENNSLFQSLTKNLNNYPELKASIRSILMEGTKLTWNAQQDEIVQMQMYGLIRNDRGTVRISNRIFETMLYNLFLSEEELKSNVFSREGDLARNQFVQDKKLNMRLILKRFIETYTEICGPLTDKFKEKDGRELFLLYLKPVINGTGNYYIEAQTRDQTRTDVIVDYLGQQYIVELKIWRGPRYNVEGEKQICEYLDYFGLDTGYMLSFNFNKKKEQGVRMVQIGDKVLYEGTL